MYYGFNNIPALYDFKNAYNSSMSPSTVHCKNTDLAWFFKRYLIQKVLSVFKFDGIPDDWAKDYFLYTLFCFGYVAIINTNKFGVIPQHCTLYGYDVFYRPTNALIANPLLQGDLEPRIGVMCELIKMQPDYRGAWDLVSYYADLLALAAETAGVSFVNSKFAFVFAAEGKAQAEGFKKLYDQIAGGNPAGFADKNMFRDDGTPAWQLFTQNLQQNYIAGQVLEDMAKIDSRFNTDIGIPNVNIAKASGVSDSEVASNNVDTMSKSELWLETIREGCEKVNDMFNLKLSCSLRFKDQAAADQEGGGSDEQAGMVKSGRTL